MYMVMHKNALFIRNRKGNYYFVRRVPNDMKSYYSSDRISFSLKTKSYVYTLSELIFISFIKLIIHPLLVILLFVFWSTDSLKMLDLMWIQVANYFAF